MKKGFTLIELLAVIVILAIISLIAIPTLAKVVNKSKTNAALVSANNFIDAVEKQSIYNELNKKAIIYEDGLYNVSNLNVQIKGQIPKKGNVIIKNKRVESARLCVGDKSFDYINEKVKLSSNDYCSDVKITLIENGNTIFPDSNGDYIIDESSGTNVYCNNGATPILNGNKLTVQDAFGNVTCKVGKSLKNTFSHLDDSENSIIMFKDEELNSSIAVGTSKNIALNLNGHSIKTINSEDLNEENISEYSKNYYVFKIAGNMIINDNTNTGLVNAYGASETILIYASGKLTVNGGNYNGRRSVANNGELIINNGNFTSKLWETINVTSSSKTTINNGTFTGVKQLIIANDGALVNIYGGIFYSNVAIELIANRGNSTINIESKKNKIYIANINTTGEKWSATTIKNFKDGEINIKGKQADNCSDTIGLNTKGICIYSKQRSILNEAGATGFINIDGATIVSENLRAVDTYSSTVNIINANIYGNTALNVSVHGSKTEYTTGLINICNSTISGSAYDMYITNLGYIKYRSDVTIAHNKLVDSKNDPIHFVLDDTITCK